MKYLVLALSAFMVLVGSLASFGSTKPVVETQQIDLIGKFTAIEKQKDLVEMTNYLVRFADKTPYVFSGSTPSGWDCSGMVVWAYSKVGVELPHSANKQAHLGKRVSEPQVGDIVVFAYSGSTSFYHSAIYLGDNKIINANLMFGTTKIQLLTDFRKSQIRFVRITR
jgi:hypothetical protein